MKFKMLEKSSIFFIHEYIENEDVLNISIYIIFSAVLIVSTLKIELKALQNILS